MYCFTDSMRPFVSGPFADESIRFFDKQGVTLLAHQARWSGAVQFVHAVARTGGAAESPLIDHVKGLVEAPVISYAPERSVRDLTLAPSYNNTWYAVAFSSELQPGEPFSTRLFGEPLELTRAADGAAGLFDSTGAAGRVSCVAAADGVEYACEDHQGLLYVWRGEPSTADVAMLPTHPTPEATHTVETILDYGCDWKYIVENNLDTPHLYWLHDGSIPPIESLGCNRQNVGSIGLRTFVDDIGVGHIGKTKTKTTKVVRFDAPNIVRHGGVSGFSEEFNIVPIGPHRTRVLLRQRFPKGPILSTLLNVPGTAALLQYLVRNWNYQIGLEDYSVMQGQAHNIDDFGAPNWKAVSTGDDLIIKQWQWIRKAMTNDDIDSEYFTRWDGTALDPAALAAAAPRVIEQPTHGQQRLTDPEVMRPQYVDVAPIADYPPVNYRPYTTGQGLLEKIAEAAPATPFAAAAGAVAGVVAGTVAQVASASHGLPM